MDRQRGRSDPHPLHHQRRDRLEGLGATASVDGDYSAIIDGSSPDEEGPGTTFLRGIGYTDSNGIVDFVSIFPGWYPGRAPHIHAIIRESVGQQSRLISTQSYFYDDDLAEIYALAPYDIKGVNSNSVYNDQFAPDDPVAAGLMTTIRQQGAGRLRLCQLQVAD